MLKRSFVAVSPNGRFIDGAAAINGKPLQRVEVHGKNLFYFFAEGSQPPVVLHVHFGMAGFFGAVVGDSQEAPPAKDTTRLTLTNKAARITAHLSAMTVKHGGVDYYKERVALLGQDPLREDADPEALWEQVHRSKKPIGLCLMSQEMVAGLGNIYRAEVLFKARLHPEQPCNTLSRETFDEVWRHSVLLLQRGFTTGSILTVDPEDAAAMGPPWTRRYIYNQATCGQCGGGVSVWDMAARKVYACTRCQPLQPGTVLPPARLKALAALGPIKVFQSHCAPDDASTLPPQKMTVARLKEELSKRSLPRVGRKPALVAALTEAIGRGTSQATSAVSDIAAPDVIKEDAESPPTGKRRRGLTAASDAAAMKDDTPVRQTSRHPSIKTEALQGKAGVAVKTDVEAPATPQQQQQPPRGRKRRKTRATPVSPRAIKQEDAGEKGFQPEGSLSFSVAAMRSQLKGLGLPTTGRREQLWERLQVVLTADTAASDAPKPTAVRPGIKGLGEVASAKVAAEEKVRAGENRAVEHVADAPALPCIRSRVSRPKAS